RARTEARPAAFRAGLVSSVEPKDLFERRRPGVRDALLEEPRHVVLPSPADVLPVEVAAGCVEVLRLEVAEDIVTGPEDRVIADPRRTKGLEHLGPHRTMGFDVLLDLFRPDSEDERGSLGHARSLTTRTTRSRGP